MNVMILRKYFIKKSDMFVNYIIYVPVLRLLQWDRNFLSNLTLKYICSHDYSFMISGTAHIEWVILFSAELAELFFPLLILQKRN